MATLDNARDLLELFQQQHTEYVLIVIQPGKKKDRALVFCNATKPDSIQMLGDTCHYIGKNVLHSIPDNSQNIQEEKPKRRRKKLTE